MKDIVGKFVVANGVMRHRYVTYEVLKETPETLQVMNIERRDYYRDKYDEAVKPDRVYKNSLGLVYLFDDEDLAVAFAAEMTEREEAVWADYTVAIHRARKNLKPLADWRSDD